MKKNFLFFVLFLVLINIAYAQPPFQTSTSTNNGLIILYPKQDVFQQNTNFTLHFHVLNSSGYMLANTASTCSIHIYDPSGSHIFQGLLSNDANTLDKDISLNTSFSAIDKSYSYNVWCNSSTQAGYLSGGYEITGSGYVQASGTGVLVVLILIPLLFGLILLIGAVSLGEDHTALKIGMFMLSPIMTFISFHFGMISLVKYFGMVELQEAIGSTTYWFSITVFVLIIYFIIYFIYKAIRYSAQEKEERLKY